jgi:type IV secretory pathway component VirB8
MKTKKHEGDRVWLKGTIVKANKTKNDNFWLICILLFLILIITSIFVITMAKYENYQNSIYSVPKGFAGVYNNLDEPVAIVVLDMKDINDIKVRDTLQLYFRQKGGAK